MRIVATVIALFICAGLLSCSGSSKVSPTPIPGIAGPWEFIAVSNNNSYITGVEVALKEGQVLVDGVEQPNGQISANSTQISFVSLDSVSQIYNATGFGGPCDAAGSSNNSLGPGNITAPNANMTFTFTENGVVFNATGTLSGDGQSFLNGTYTQSGTSCADSGGAITGTVVPKLNGMYAGKICQPSDLTCTSTPDTATATLSESSSGTLTLTLAFTGGPDSGASLTLTGPVTGNAFSASGTFQGQVVTYYGYYEVVKNVASVYFVNATSNTAQPSYAGTLPLYVQP
jgi:hypothetical protein